MTRFLRAMAVPLSANVTAGVIRPDAAYTTKDAYTLNSGSTYDWVAERWSVPVNVLVTKLLKIGDQPVSIGAGVRYWAESPTTGAPDLGARAVVTFRWTIRGRKPRIFLRDLRVAITFW